MKLIANWRGVLGYAWSIKLMLLAGIFSGLEFALPHMRSFFPLDDGVFSALSIVTIAGAFVARLIAQRNPQEGAPDPHEEGGI